MATTKDLYKTGRNSLNRLLQSGALKDALAFSQKYTPEDSVYKADQTRINDAISNLTRERFPEFEKARMSASGQFLANESKRNLVEGEQREAKRNFLGALGAARRTKGGLRGLAQLLGKQSDIESKIGTAGRREQRQAAAAAQQEQKMVGDYNRGLGDQAKTYDFMKKRDIDALKSEKTRIQGAYGDTRARKMGDIMESLEKRRDDKISGDSKDASPVSPTLLSEIIDNSRQPASQEKILGMIKNGDITLDNIQDIDMPEDNPDTVEEDLQDMASIRGSMPTGSQRASNPAVQQRQQAALAAVAQQRADNAPFNSTPLAGPRATPSAATAPTAQESLATAFTEPGAMQNAVQNIQNIKDPAARAQMINQIRAARKLAFGQ
jgi:hypothetical protein